MRKIYLIVGASSDIGMTFIRSAINKDDSAEFYAHYRNMNDTLAVIKDKFDSRIHLIQTDLSKEDGVTNVIHAVQETPTHILHLPAGKIAYKRLRQVSEEDIQTEMRIQVYSLLEIYRAFLPKMAKEGYGRAVTVTTSYTHGLPPRFLTAYTTVKYALLGLVKSAAVEYAGKGIHINAVSPEMVDTKFLSSIDERIVENVANGRPLGKNLSPQEVVTAIEFLFSDGNPMYGENLYIG